MQIVIIGFSLKRKLIKQSLDYTYNNAFGSISIAVSPDVKSQSKLVTLLFKENFSFSYTLSKCKKHIFLAFSRPRLITQMEITKKKSNSKLRKEERNGNEQRTM